MRNFTNSAEFDDTLPLETGAVEVSFRVTPERFAESLGAWLTQRGKGEGQTERVEVEKLSGTRRQVGLRQKEAGIRLGLAIRDQAGEALFAGLSMAVV